MKNSSRLILLLLSSLLLVNLGQARAHPASQSRVLISVDKYQVGLSLDLPAEQLQQALPGVRHWQTLKHIDSNTLNTYLTAHLQMFSNGEPLTIQHIDGGFTSIEDEPFVHIEITLVNQNAKPLSSLALNYDVIQHKVMNHRTLVFLRSDFTNGVIHGEPELLDILRYRHHQISLTRTENSLWYGAQQSFLLGVTHILEGTDHIAFLLSLLMVAGLVRKKNRWQVSAASFKDCLVLVTAFAVGHSLTLALNVIFDMPDFSRWVEPLVALSVLLAAMNIIRPIITKGQPVLAFGFGLIHGMAFASALNVYGLQLQSKLLALAGFNLGIELIQVFLMLILLPCINLWRKSGGYSVIQTVTGMLFISFSSLWLLQNLMPGSALSEQSFSLTYVELLLSVSVIVVLSGLKYVHTLLAQRTMQTMRKVPEQI